jgi:hypothetical protein
VQDKGKITTDQGKMGKSTPLPEKSARKQPLAQELEKNPEKSPKKNPEKSPEKNLEKNPKKNHKRQLICRYNHQIQRERTKNKKKMIHEKETTSSITSFTSFKPIETSEPTTYIIFDPTLANDTQIFDLCNEVEK